MITKNKTLGQKKIAALQMPEAGAYWKEQLVDAVPSNLLPDHRKNTSNPITQSYNVSQIKIEASKVDAFLNCQECDIQHSNEVFTLLVLSLLYSIDNGMNEDLLVGFAEYKDGGILEFPIRANIQHGHTYRDILDQIHNKISNHKEYAGYPTDLIIETTPIQINIIEDTFVDLADIYSKYIFSCNLEMDSIGNWKFIIAGVSSLYMTKTLDSIAAKLSYLMELITANADENIEASDLFQTEDALSYELLNMTNRQFSNSDSIASLLEHVFRKFENEKSIVSHEQEVTFKQLEDRSKKIAAFIQKNTEKSESIIAVLCERSIDFLATVFGVILSGKAYLPLDPKAPQERNEIILKQANSQTVLYLDKHSAVLEGIELKKFNISEIYQTNAEYYAEPISPDDLAYVIFTSGSTGTPKGVEIKHKSVINRIEWMQHMFALESSDVILHKTPSTFDVSVWEIFWWAITGTKVAVLPADEEANPVEIIKAIEENKVTTLHFVPSMLNAFLDYVDSSSSYEKIKSLKRVFSSGEALTPNHVEKFHRYLSDVELINLYGPTEATVDVTWHRTSKGENPVPIGKPIDNTHIYILDKTRRLRPIGMIGELAIAGTGVAKGYIHDPFKTKSSFIDIPHLEEGKVYLTGDLARIRQDGTIEYFGRNDRQVKVRGFRIELGEIETALTNLPSVSDALVLTNLEADQMLHLYAFIIQKDRLVDVKDIRQALTTVLPNYMIPEKLVILSEFPLTRNGKVDRKLLLEMSNERAVDEKIAPQTREEKMLCGIWQDVLGIPDIGINENFFALGGNSINFVSVVALAHKSGLIFTFQHLFKYPTIQDLITHVNLNDTSHDDVNIVISNFQLIKDEDKTNIPDDIEDAYPMSMLQSGLVYQSSIMEGDNNYHDIVTYTIDGELDVPTFRKAVQLLVDSQPIFRTSYNLEHFSEYLQLVHSTIDTLPLHVYDLRGLHTEQEKEDIYEQWFWKEQHRAFEWDKPGLVQLHVHILSESQYKYSISQHNSALDGWSMNKVHTFLFKTYFDMVNGVDPNTRLLESNNHNRTFIYLEQKAIHSEEYRHFWRDMLKDVPEGTIPRSREEDTRKGNEVIFQDIILPEGLSAKLVTLAKELKIPVKDILLASHVKFLAILTRKDDVFMGYEIGGRPELLGSENALGVFLNTMPFRVILDSNSSWKDFILHVYGVEANILPFRRYPMAQVKQDLTSRTILFETVFNFTHFYSLKDLRGLPGFDNIDVRAAAITEFPLRIEYSRHFYTDEIELSLHYHTSKYDLKDIEFFGTIFVDILESMVHRTEENHQILMEEEKLDEFKYYTEKMDQPSRNEEDSIRLDINLDLDIAINRVKDVWSNVLKISKENLKLDDDFFFIGGNSLAAMKVALFFKKDISLKQLMQKSILLELASELANKEKIKLSQEVSLLTCLSKSSESECNIIFIPYAGGNALNFIPIAKEFEKNNVDISVFAAELPAHDPNLEHSTFVNFEDTVNVLVEEICSAMKDKPFMVWGHCVGSALAFEVVRKLESRNFYPQRLFLAAKNMISQEDCDMRVRNATNLQFSDIAELYSEWSGTSNLSTLGQSYESKLVDIFKHDSIQANTYLSNLWNQKEKLIRTPTSIVIAKDDPITEDYNALWTNWNHWITQCDLVEFEKGGHYFLRNIPADVVKYIQGTLSS
ncbi:amino acid adenylation domain-containing protein [Paenibacillus shirakamiensis]|uniref:Amino acid adenylation domain-containing protein n=1 Tax=Paenibacillus shirakamiensis TaxID=1265935 RepID=A0ABS4JEG6_9BACL|nr:non-ribosomal peptide synthetase [Paenibacillus shirakamiensis]MBP1998989.1 amino acid adenylation domain-containing protein [Paenibacillus shirakamiensis]